MSPTEPSIISDEIHACILVGGLSARMGTDKAELKLGGKSLLEIAKAKLAELDLNSSVIRKDIVPRCGPLGGIITGLAQCRAQMILFLPCDMPFVSTNFIRAVITAASRNSHGACAYHGELAGFPLVIHAATETEVVDQHSRKQFSLQKLFRRLDLARKTPADPQRELFNINTEEDYRQAKLLHKQSA